MKGKKIVIKAGNIKITGTLNDSETAKELYENLPIENGANTWGDEIYFSIPIVGQEEKEYLKELVDLGDIGFWKEGNALCFFFGPTPMSRTPDEIRPASACLIIGKLEGDPKILKEVQDQELITVDREENE